MRQNNRDTNDEGYVGKKNIYYILFAIIGLLLMSIGFIFQLKKSEVWFQVFLNLGITVLAVALIEGIWGRLGGDPVIRAISSLWKATNILRELETSGISSIKTQRRQLDNPEYNALLCDLLNSATQVDLMSWSMRTQITRHKDIMDAIAKAIRSNMCRVRVMTFRPFHEISDCSGILAQRINEEKRLPGGEAAVDRIRGNLIDTCSQFNAIKAKFENDPERKDCLQIKATNEIMIYSNIIRIDDRMWVSPYSASVRGGENPVFELAGIHSSLFQHYQNEFNHIWDPPKPH